MSKPLFRIVSIAAVLAAFAAPGYSKPAGSNVEVRTVPPFVKRVFVPAVAGTSNTLRIERLRIDKIVEAPKGYSLTLYRGGIRIQAPAGEAAGYAKVRAGNRDLTLTIINLVPYNSMKNGWLDGYRIGEYLTKPLRGLSTYNRPKGFIRLTKANRDLWVSDHYRLRDFQCKLDGKSKFLLLRTEALFKLELLQNELHKMGHRFERFTIMSGYRTPFYNAMIGNDTSYSRHVYGDAMDIYIDTDGNGSMDDLNRDGRINTEDARLVMRVAEKIDKSSEWNWLKGGAGIYRANAAHGPYLHVDARGYIARWGV
jgi:hypothetical protein